MFIRMGLLMLVILSCVSCGGSSGESEQSSSVEVEQIENEIPTPDPENYLDDKVVVGNITFNFDQQYSIGQFIDGQWWVHNDGGDVIVTSITPDSFDDEGRIRNGAEINPVNSSTQGFDGLANTDVSTDMSYDEAKNVDPGITNEPLTLVAGSSLLKAISKQENSSRPVIDEVAILTVLQESPGESAFRPAYAGSDKSLIFTESDLDYSVLGQFEPLDSTPHIDSYLSEISGVWLDHNSEWTQRDIHPESSMPTYGREIARYTAEVGLQLQFNYSDAEKREALIAMVQYAIDLYGVLQLSPLNDKEDYYWYNNGGHNQGRKLPLLIAGLVLNHSGMQEIVDAQQGDNLLFQEDQQTFYVLQSDIDYELTTEQVEEGVQAYQQEDLGLADWSTRPWDRRYTTMDADWGRSYRDVNGCNSVTTALAVRMMGAVDDWNWDAFFDYSDRYFILEEDDTTESFSGNEIRQVVVDIWHEYRDDFEDLYTRDLAP